VLLLWQGVVQHDLQQQQQAAAAAAAAASSFGWGTIFTSSTDTVWHGAADQ
jgi:hypothetical protein